MFEYLKVLSKDVSRSLIFLYIGLLLVIPLSFVLIVILLWGNNYSQINDWLLIGFLVAWELIFLGGLEV